MVRQVNHTSMGKKSKQKKHRHQHQQSRQQVGQAQVMPMQVAATDQAPSQTMTAARPAGLEIGEQYIRRDIIRILVFLGVIAIILIALVITNDRTTVISSAGKHLSHFLRLQ